MGTLPGRCSAQNVLGARAIIEPGKEGRNLVLLPDRQSFEQGEDSRMDKDDFTDWINNKVLPAIRKQVKAAAFREWGNYFRLTSDSGSFHCEATPKNSGGLYLYIGCWET